MNGLMIQSVSTSHFSKRMVLWSGVGVIGAMSGPDSRSGGLRQSAAVDDADAARSGERTDGEGARQPTPSDHHEDPVDPTAGAWRTWLVRAAGAGIGRSASQVGAGRAAAARRTPALEGTVLRWARKRHPNHNDMGAAMGDMVGRLTVEVARTRKITKSVRNETKIR